MGQKVHPIGFRIGLVHDWQARWYGDKQFAQFLKEDIELRRAIQTRYRDAGISRVEIERQANQLSLTIHTARPGIVIGRGGQRVDEMRQVLEQLTGKRVRLNIQEIRQPELDAYLVARSIADQIEHRVSYRRAMRQASNRTLQAGAKGIKVICAGRLGGHEIARRESILQGRVPLHTLKANIDYGMAEAHTTLGRIGVKVWIYKGDTLGPSRRAEEMAFAEAEAPAGEVVEAEIIRAHLAPEEDRAAAPSPETAATPVAETEPKPTAQAGAGSDSDTTMESTTAETEDATAQEG